VLFTDASVARAQAWVRSWGETSAIPTRKLRALVEEIGSRNYFFGAEALWPAFASGAVPILDTLLQLQPTVVLAEPDACAALWHARRKSATQQRERAIEQGRPQVEVEAHLVPAQTLWAQLERQPQVRAQKLVLDGPNGPQGMRPPVQAFSALAEQMQLRRQDAAHGEILDPLVAELQRRVARQDVLFLACGSRGHAERLRELLLARKWDLPLWDALPPAASWRKATSRVAIAVAQLSCGLDDVGHGVAVLTDVELFGTARTTRVRVRKKAPPKALNTLQDLREGDPVIHQDHGIGRYLGLKRLVLNGIDGDFVHLEYAAGDKLYVPVFRINVLQLYRGSADTVRLDKLGGQRWERAQARVRDAVLSTAHQLLALQAQRKAQTGFALPPPDETFRAFEATFPFEETVDQLKAIEAVLADLQKDVPMDRLVCGDVGFGKTEVAMRAAFLAAHGGRQVAVLVPTTVLAEQHGASFAERMAQHGVQVEILSRFRTPQQIRDVLERTRAGTVDVLVGTHRLLSPDVAFKDLGLLVVDEEQRFGVKNKERIKRLRAHVHVLTLSATPIPRTLHMASVGLRDLSIIQTPPAERSAIRTEVMRFDAGVIAEAIRRELHRGGQTFVVHNRVHSIGHMAERIASWVPEAKLCVAHGQMGAEDLEQVMVDFARRKYNVLVCTAIIESGIDIPTANTMIVDRADTFGLSQLYQLRGRIGRGRERAYAFLMLPAEEALSREATERLGILKRFSELGSGFQIASHDLELRGAGDLLGADQSGHIAAVGFELYTELLNEAVEQARGQVHKAEVEPEIKIAVTAVLPERYVAEPMQRLAYYQRMAQAQSDTAIFDIFEELRQIFGPPPEEACAWVETMVLRRRLKALGASGLSASMDEIAIRVGLTFVPEAPIDRVDLLQRCQNDPGHYRLLPSGRLALTVPPLSGESPDQAVAFLRAIRQAVGSLRLTGGAVVDAS
jgi:transcription-repair coupling factor (superfamily II helicase)